MVGHPPRVPWWSDTRAGRLPLAFRTEPSFSGIVARLLVDLHLDLSLNALEWNRDLRQPLETVRADEEGLRDLRGRGKGVVSFPEMRRAGIGLCVATQIAGCMKPRGPVASWNSPEQAWAQTQGQLAWYRCMEREGELRQIRNAEQLREHLAEWERDPDDTPIGYVLSLEGADSLVRLSDLETAWEAGLRAVGPAHYGVGRYAMGHDEDGPLSAAGRDLLREMDRLELILDVTHLCERTFWDALDSYEGPVWASHSNCRELVDDVRQLTDKQLGALVERGGIIGTALDAWMLVPGWVRGETTPDQAGVRLEHVADHIDHVCQIAGNARHAALGSDLDGGFGRDQCPLDVASIADLRLLTEALTTRGYSEPEIEMVLSGNAVRFLEEAWVL